MSRQNSGTPIAILASSTGRRCFSSRMNHICSVVAPWRRPYFGSTLLPQTRTWRTSPKTQPHALLKKRGRGGRRVRGRLKEGRTPTPAGAPSRLQRDSNYGQSAFLNGQGPIPPDPASSGRRKRAAQWRRRPGLSCERLVSLAYLFRRQKGDFHSCS